MEHFFHSVVIHILLLLTGLARFAIARFDLFVSDSNVLSGGLHFKNAGTGSFTVLLLPE